MSNSVLRFKIDRNMSAAETAVRDALQSEGFGILTEVDVAAVLKARLGVDVPPHRLLGACNPRIAHTSIAAEPDIAAYLPCGIALRQGDSADETIVTIQNPLMIGETFGVPELTTPSQEAHARLRSALSKVGTEI